MIISHKHVDQTGPHGNPNATGPAAGPSAATARLQGRSSSGHSSHGTSDDISGLDFARDNDYNGWPDILGAPYVPEMGPNGKVTPLPRTRPPVVEPGHNRRKRDAE